MMISTCFILFLLAAVSFVAKGNMDPGATKICNCSDLGYSKDEIERKDWPDYRMSEVGIGKITSESIVLEIGGNTGRDTDLFLKQGATVYVFEPIPKYFQALKEKYAGQTKVNLFNFGLGAWERLSTIFMNGKDDEGSSALVESKATVLKLDINIEDVVQVLYSLKLPKIDVINLNCEGCEYEVLQTLLNHPKLLSKIQRFNIGYHYYAKDFGMCTILTKLTRHHKSTYCTEPWVGFVKK